MGQVNWDKEAWQARTDNHFLSTIAVCEEIAERVIGSGRSARCRWNILA